MFLVGVNRKVTVNGKLNITIAETSFEFQTVTFPQGEGIPYKSYHTN